MNTETEISDLRDRIEALERIVASMNLESVETEDQGTILNDDGIPIGLDLIGETGVIMSVYDNHLYYIEGSLFTNLLDATIAASYGNNTQPWLFWKHGGVSIGELFG